MSSTMTRTEAIPFESMKEAAIARLGPGRPSPSTSISAWICAPISGVNCLQYMPTANAACSYVIPAWRLRQDPPGHPGGFARRWQSAAPRGNGRGSCVASRFNDWARIRTQADFDGVSHGHDTSWSSEDILCLAEVLRERDRGASSRSRKATGHNRRGPGVPGRAGRGAILHNAVPVRPQEPADPREAAGVDRPLPGRRGSRCYRHSICSARGPVFTLDDWNLYDASLRAGARRPREPASERPAEARRSRNSRGDAAGDNAAAEKLRIVQAGVGGPMEKLRVQDVTGAPKTSRSTSVKLRLRPDRPRRMGKTLQVDGHAGRRRSVRRRSRSASGTPPPTRSERRPHGRGDPTTGASGDSAAPSSWTFTDCR